jgi:hypothetical protein
MGENKRRYEREVYRKEVGKSSTIFFHADKITLHKYLLFS